MDRDQEHKPLTGDQDYFDTEEQLSPSISSSTHRWKWATYILAVLSATQFLLLVWPRHPQNPRNTYETGFPTDFNDAKPHIMLEERRFGSPIRATENGTLFRVENPDERPYTGDYQLEELRPAWDELIRERYFLFEESEIADMNEDTFQSNLEPLPQTRTNIIIPQTGIYGGVDMLHSLHCLDALRRRLKPGGHHHALPSDLEDMHIDHCVDQLRQSIMCAGDLTPVTLRPIQQTRDNAPFLFLLGETERKHTCRSFDAIKQWVQSRGKQGAVQLL